MAPPSVDRPRQTGSADFRRRMCDDVKGTCQLPRGAPPATTDGCMTQPASEDDHVQLQLGLYVLGGLSPEDRQAVEEHLRRCPRCDAERADLAEVTAFLSLLTRQ